MINRSEAEFIQRIYEDIAIRLNRTPLDMGYNIVGMDFHLTQLKSLIKVELDEVLMVGIYGIGGIGKTTISKAIYNDISSQFDGCSFLGNVGGKCEDGLLKLQKTLLQDIVKCKVPKFNNISQGINVIKERLRSKRVLIVLDDVDNYMQLENLAGKHENKLDMHDLVQQMGQEIVRQECLKEPGNRSRLWDCNDVDSVLTRNTGTQAIEGLFVQGSLASQISTNSFTKLNRLRLLKVYYPHMWKKDFKALKNLDFPYFELRYFHFKGYPLESLPTNFHAKNLVELNLKHSSIKQLWQGNEILDNLKVINLSYSEKLVEISDFSRVTNLEILILKGCRSLESLPRNFHKLERLQSLSCKDCLKMKSFPAIKGNMSKLREIDLTATSIKELPSSIAYLKALQHLDLSWCKSLRSLSESICNLSSLKTLILEGCSNLKGFPEINDDMENLKMLDLSRTGIKELPSSIGHLKALKHLNLLSCGNLAKLPESICNLRSLETLILEGCSNLEGFPKINDDMENLKRLNLKETCIEKLPSSIGHLKALKHLDLFSCKSLRSLSESICNLSSLETLILEGCSNLKGFPEIKDDMENLKRLDLSFTGIEELPSSIGRLKALQHLDLSSCKSLRCLSESICNLSSLETLILKGCSNLKGFLEIIDYMKNLEHLDLSFTGIEELPSSIGRLKALQHLDLSSCKSLRSLSESICNLSSLETLILEGCSNLKGFPEIKDDMENLKRLDLSFIGIKELSSSIGRLKALKHLNLKCCTKLVSLPDIICNLSSLETLILEGCSNLKGFPKIKDDMENLKRLDLSFTSIEEFPSSIGRLKALQHLDLSYCKSLRCLSESICNLSSLETLILEGCSNLKGFPEIKDDMENLKMLDLSFTGIEELPSSIGRLKALKHLNLKCCAELVSLPDSICRALKKLDVQKCPKLERVEVNLVGSLDLTCCILKQRVIWWSNNLLQNEVEGEVLNHYVLSLSSLVESCSRDYRGFHLSALEVLSVGNFSPIQRRILSDIFRQSSLKSVCLRNCNLMEEGVPSDIWNLSSLVNLSLSNCSLTEGEILNHICHVSSLQNLSLDGNHFSSIPANIIQLSKLRTSACITARSFYKFQSFHRVYELLMSTTAHAWKLYQVSQVYLVFPCSSASNQQLRWSYWRKKFEILTLYLMPGNNGIPEWISHKKKGSKIGVELPENWWEDNNFLGFALCSVFEYEDPWCQLTFHNFYFDYPDGCLSKSKFMDLLIFSRSFLHCRNCGESNRVLVAFYPKVAIENKHWSNEWRHLKASFYGEEVKVEECGLHLIYKTNIFNRDSNATNHWPRLLSENTDFNVKEKS
ncbi:Protein suppressor of npr1-1, constitutive 1 [Vitis vinifera]|uniref:ADP-ribosyl cyclase/cyclic ADP-ribose hydrolase n=1 Tax=Vitis vinifera TaxID=29760 RepID=A0A438GRT9_VITVI|nr:Protein suppressor of npr1-1, constitutive 1 [Vitis vinifera]